MSTMSTPPDPDSDAFDPAVEAHRRHSLPRTEGLRAAAISMSVWQPAMTKSTMQDRLAAVGVYHDGRFKQYTDDGTRLLFPDSTDR